MATNILADRLTRLEHAGLIVRAGRGKGAQYGLTDKGLNLLPAMLEVVSWSARYDKGTAAPKAFVARIRSDPDDIVAAMRGQLSARYGLGAKKARRANVAKAAKD